MRLSRLFIILTSLLYFIVGCSSNKEAQEGELMSDQDMLKAGNLQFQEGAYQDAIHTFKSLILNHPTSDLHIQAQLQIAAAYGQLDNYEDQMDALLSLLQENIIPGQVPQIYIQLGLFYEKAAQFNPGTVSSDTSDYKTAIEYYTKAFKYKDSEDMYSKANGAYRRALSEARIGAVDQAIIDYKIVQQFFPETDFAVLARMKLQNPADISELPSDPESIAAFRTSLNIPESSESIPMEEEPSPKTEPASQDVNSYKVDDSVFEQSNPENPVDTVIPQEALPDTTGEKK